MKSQITCSILLCLMQISLVVPWRTLAAAETRKPNVVFILADDLGYRELGCYGQEKIKTPNIDQLAREGMRLTQHYCGNAVCAPSRCVLLTGKHPGHAFVRDNRSTPPEGQWPIPDSEVTLAEAFQQAGYVTGAFGKWGLGGPDSSGQPLEQGVDRFFGYNCQAHAHSYYPSYLWDNDKHISLNNHPEVPGHASLDKGDDTSDPAAYDKFKGQDYAPDRINEQVLNFIRANKDQPFFLYYPSVIPHVALHVPDEDLKPYTELGWKDPPFTRSGGYGYTPHYTPRAAYAAMISRLDKYVGRVLDLLDELELADDTIVVFSSDNGTTHLGEEVDYEFFKSVGELRGLKGSLYEGGVRVPGIVRWPGKVPAQSESDRVSGFEDWMPTLLDMTGNVDAFPPQIDGISMAKTLQGESQKPRPYLYREFTGYGGQQTIRVGDWKAVRQKMSSGNLDIELYNIAEDIGESNNVAAQHPDIVERLDAMMREVRTPSEEFPLVPLDAAVGTRGSRLQKAFIDGSGPGWKSLAKNDFVNVNCEPDTWRWERGVAYCTGQPVGVIRSKKQLTNFELVCEWKHKQKGGNSGVFLWASPESIAKLEAGQGRLPDGIEVQVLDLGYADLYLQGGQDRKADWFTSHGDVFPTGPASMKPFPPTAPNGKRSFPSKNLTKGVNQWNHYYVRAIDGEVRLWVNGEEVSGGTECSPASGYLCLESEGAPVEFRNLKIRELP